MKNHDIMVTMKVYEFGMGEYDYEVIAKARCSCGWRAEAKQLQIDGKIEQHERDIIRKSLGYTFTVETKF